MIERRPATEPPPLEAVCPYVRTEAGWRAATAIRDHRCGAVEPPVQVALEKQRRYCVSPDHVGCATYLAARAARAERDERIGSRAGGGRRRPIARTAPLVLDAAGSPVAALVGAVERSRVGQAALVGTMALAAGAFVLARTGSPGDPGPANNPTAVAGGIPSPSASPTLASTPVPTTAIPSATPTPAATPEPTVVIAPATGTPAPTPTPQIYTVRAGDTLVSIAARFGTTVKAIQDLNGIDDPRRLRVGQVLEIP